MDLYETDESIIRCWSWQENGIMPVILNLMLQQTRKVKQAICLQADCLQVYLTAKSASMPNIKLQPVMIILVSR